jgi:hypothetical protein
MNGIKGNSSGGTEAGATPWQQGCRRRRGRQREKVRGENAGGRNAWWIREQRGALQQRGDLRETAGHLLKFIQDVVLKKEPVEINKKKIKQKWERIPERHHHRGADIWNKHGINKK